MTPFGTAADQLNGNATMMLGVMFGSHHLQSTVESRVHSVIDTAHSTREVMVMLLDGFWIIW